MTTQMFPVELFRINLSDFTATILFNGPGQSGEPYMGLAMPLAVGKLLCQVLRKALKEHEGKIGPIAVPPNIMQGAGLSQEDWDSWLGPPK